MEISNWILSLETGAKELKGQQQVVRLTNGGVGVIRKSAGNEMLGNLDTLEDLLLLVCYSLLLPVLVFRVATHSACLYSYVAMLLTLLYGHVGTPRQVFLLSQSLTDVHHHYLLLCTLTSPALLP